jgi:hypothetical protein
MQAAAGGLLGNLQGRRMIDHDIMATERGGQCRRHVKLVFDQQDAHASFLSDFCPV